MLVTQRPVEQEVDGPRVVAFAKSASLEAELVDKLDETKCIKLGDLLDLYFIDFVFSVKTK